MNIDLKTTLEVSIIIVNYNTSNLINSCIESIFKMTSGVKYEIIIVDNATEDLSNTIYNARDSRVKLVQLTKNIGFGLANNEGFKIARGRNIFCLNPDTIIINNAIRILSNYLDEHPEVGACGGNLYDEDMKPTLSFRRIFPGIFWELNELLHLLPERIIFGKNSRFNSSDKPFEVSYITGADLMLRHEVAKAIGGFSKEFFMYYEETDLCKRITKMGYKIVSVPSAIIQHLEGRSFGDSEFNKGRIERSERGRCIYYRRNNSKLNRLISNGIYKLFLYSRITITQNIQFTYRIECLKAFSKNKKLTGY